MSVYSGKFDLFDHISGQGGWFDKDGRPVEFNDKNVCCFYSDEFLDFEAFKKKTRGVLHQHYKVDVDEFNLQFVKEHCKFFDYTRHTKTVPDKRAKSGVKELGYYTFTYYTKEYGSFKELNKHGVYVEIDIHFDTILDLIPYYPYLVSAAASDKDKQYVVISKESYVDSEFKKHLQCGWISEIDYKKKLQDHYLEVCKKLLEKTEPAITKVQTEKLYDYYTRSDFSGQRPADCYNYISKINSIDNYKLPDDYQLSDINNANEYKIPDDLIWANPDNSKAVNTEYTNNDLKYTVSDANNTCIFKQIAFADAIKKYALDQGCGKTDNGIWVDIFVNESSAEYKVVAEALKLND